MKCYYFIPVICILLFFSQYIQAQKFAYKNADVYLLHNDFTPAKNFNDAACILQIIKYSDTNYTCRFYNKFGPMIKQETFFDSGLSISNGWFMWYGNNGNLDSTTYIYRGHKIKSTYYDNNVKPVVYIKYKDDKMFEKRDYVQNIYIDSVGNSSNLTDVEKKENEGYERYLRDSSSSSSKNLSASSNANWSKYINKHLLVTDRFEGSMPPGHYRIIVSFLINTDGKIDEVQVLHSIEWSQDLEILKIFENGPHWQPATQNGKSVIYRQRQNFDFVIGNQ